MRGDPEVREPLLDFFGISVKANEVPAHSQRMEILERKVNNPLWCCGAVLLLCLCRLKESGPCPISRFHVRKGIRPGLIPLLLNPSGVTCRSTSGLQVEESAPDPINSFHVDSPPQLPRWAQDCGWSPQGRRGAAAGGCAGTAWAAGSALLRTRGLCGV